MPNPQQKKTVQQHVDYFKKLFFMEQWAFEIVYSKKRDDNNDGETFADLSCTSHEYFTTTMTIYPAFWKKDPAFQKQAICHEMLHIITNIQVNLLWHALYKESAVTWREKNEAREKATSWIERIITKLLNQ